MKIKHITSTVVAIAAMAITGCSSMSGTSGVVSNKRIPDEALLKTSSSNKVAEKTIYFVESQSFPQNTIEQSFAVQPASSTRSIDPAVLGAVGEVVGQVGGQVVQAVPQIANTQAGVKTSIGTINREFLATGYSNTNELAGLRDVLHELKEMQGNSILRNNSVEVKQSK